MAEVEDDLGDLASTKRRVLHEMDILKGYLQDKGRKAPRSPAGSSSVCPLPVPCPVR